MQASATICRLSLFLCMALASGCSLKPITPSSEAKPDAKPAALDQQLSGEHLVALDLVSALVQLQELSPANVILQPAQPSDPFDVYLNDALESVGYQQPSEYSVKKTLLVTTIITSNEELTPASAEGLDRTYQLNVGNIKVRRNYRFDRSGVMPSSRMLMRGVDVIRVKIDDSLFKQPASDVAKVATASGLKETSDNSEKPPNGTLNNPVEPDLAEPALDTTSVAAVKTALKSTPDKTPNETPDKTPKALPPLRLSIMSNQGQSLSVGDSMRMSVEAGQDSQVHCYYQDGAGTVARVFPNRFASNSLLRAGQTLVIPTTDEWQLTAVHAGKVEKFMCLAFAPELAQQLEPVPDLPDLKPLAVTDLGQIQSRYQAIAGTRIVERSVDVAVNQNTGKSHNQGN